MNTIDEQFVNCIYGHLLKYCPLAAQYKEDALQEIRLIILTTPKEDVFKKAHSAIDKLLKSYGYSRRKGKNNYLPFYNKYELTEEENELFDKIDKLYIDENLTAKEVCSQLNIEYSPRLHVYFSTIFPKMTHLLELKKEPTQLEIGFNPKIEPLQEVRRETMHRRFRVYRKRDSNVVQMKLCF